MKDNGWDWPFIMYAGKVWFRMTEEQIWKSKPRRFFSLLEVHMDILQKQNGDGSPTKRDQKTQGRQDQYIDQVTW